MLSKEAVIVLRHYLQEGLTKTAIARKLGITRRTVQRYVKNGKDEPRYGPRSPRGSKLDAYKPYLRERLTIYPELTGMRLLTEIRALGYAGATRFSRSISKPNGLAGRSSSSSGSRWTRVSRHRWISPLSRRRSGRCTHSSWSCPGRGRCGCVFAFSRTS